MVVSAWEVTDVVDLPEGHRYTLVLKDREVMVLHRPATWRGWNGQSVCEVTGAMKAAVLDYERS
jgi:hypothetical protein